MPAKDVAKDKKQDPKPQAGATKQPAAAKKDDKDKPPTLADLTAGFLKKKEAYDKQHETLSKRLASSKVNIERLQVQVARAEVQLSQLDAPKVREDLVEPLSKELLKSMPGYVEFDAAGPMGIQSAVTITFHQKGASEEEKLHGKKSRSITLITKMPNGGLGVRDYGKDTKEFAVGSIGYASGLNHPAIQVPENAEVAWLAKYVK